MKALLVLLGGALVLALPAAAAKPPPPPTIAGCPVFPPSNPWNQPVSALPVAADSAQMVAAIGLDASFHANFGSGLWEGHRIGMPYVVVNGKNVPKSRVHFGSADESDKGPYPIPRNVPIEGDPEQPADSDRHALIIDRDSCRLYELYQLRWTSDGWEAWAGAIWNLRSNALRPNGWTSADAGGLPIFPGLVRWPEVAAGRIDHALRFSAPNTRAAHIYPARHDASYSHDPSLPPMGLRVRLKASVDPSTFPPQARVVVRALQRYGMILADNGSPWEISGAPSEHWSNDQLRTLGRLTGRDFEVVDTSSLKP